MSPSNGLGHATPGRTFTEEEVVSLVEEMRRPKFTELPEWAFAGRGTNAAAGRMVN